VCRRPHLADLNAKLFEHLCCLRSERHEFPGDYSKAFTGFAGAQCCNHGSQCRRINLLGNDGNGLQRVIDVTNGLWQRLPRDAARSLPGAHVSVPQ
jgi:hypothetical protein